MIEQIKAAVRSATVKKQKLAMFHLQVLKNADDPASLNPKDFCKRSIGSRILGNRVQANDSLG